MINRLRESFTQVDNTILNNPKLSLKAKGLYAFLCSKPDSWDFSYAGLEHQLKEAEKAIRSGLKELVDIKVLLRTPKKGADNNFNGWNWIINPTEEDLSNGSDPLRKYPKQEVPISGSTQKGEEISNNDLSNTNLSNTDIKIAEKQSFLQLTQSELIDNKVYIEKIKEKYNIENTELKEEIENFVIFWTQKGVNGKKEKWEKEKTFDIRARFYFWIQRWQKWNKKSSPKKSELDNIVL